MKNITCEYIRVISKYIKSILAVLSIDFQNTINTSETKCLNTAIMIVVVLIGSEQFSELDKCSVANTIDRMNTTEITNNQTVIDELYSSIKDSTSGMFYILLTDGMLKKNNNTNSEQVYFPGHVFIIDKNEACYTLYQSYINEYSLKDNREKEKCVCMSYAKIQKYIGNIEKLLTTSELWNKNTTKFWKSMTNVESEQFIGCNFDNIYICFKKFEHDRTIDKTLSFIDTKLKSERNAEIQNDFTNMRKELTLI